MLKFEYKTYRGALEVSLDNKGVVFITKNAIYDLKYYFNKQIIKQEIFEMVLFELKRFAFLNNRCVKNQGLLFVGELHNIIEEIDIFVERTLKT